MSAIDEFKKCRRKPLWPFTMLRTWHFLGWTEEKHANHQWGQLIIRLGSQVVCEYKVRVLTLCHGVHPEVAVQHQMRSDNGQEW